MSILDRPEDLGRGLDPELRKRLDRGDHEAVASELLAADRAREAGWVLEQIWDFASATRCYLRGGHELDALRTAVEERRPDLLETVLQALEQSGSAELLRAGAQQLARRGLHELSARLLELAEAGPELQAAALLRAGDRLAAARVLAEAGQPRAALDALGTLELHASPPREPEAHALAAQLRWDLGDAEGTARHAQEARRAGAIEGDSGRRVRVLLARALASLGHDLAGQLVLGEGAGGTEGTPPELEHHGRYRVTGTLPPAYAGAAYVGVDRLTLQEVELHMLLAEYGELDRPEPAVLQAVERFLQVAEAANRLGHPAIRPILRTEAREGLLVMPRREGPLLRSLIRPPGLEQATARARSIVAFMLDGLATAHAHGLVHGSLLPSTIVCDPLGRPLLGPFGANHLSGLTATRTGGLEELLAITPPEQRSGGAPTQASDIYMIGALWAALLTGRLAPTLDELPAIERELIAKLLAEDPDERPSARVVLTRLQSPVEDLSELARAPLPGPDESMRAATLDPRLGRPITVVAAEGWSEALLDALCMSRNPWLQTILDREGRTFQLAAWPEGCRTLAPETDWRSMLDPLALELLTPTGEPNAFEPTPTPEFEGEALREAVIERLDRLGGSAIVVTPADEFMLALDRLLGA